MAAMGTAVTQDVVPPDFSTRIGRIRALIPDVEQVDYAGDGAPEYMFSDAHLEGLFAISQGDDTARLYRAAASALRALAVSEGLIQKVIKTEDLQTDGAKLASALLSGARALDERANAVEDEAESMMIVDFQPVPTERFPYSLRGFPAGWTGGGGDLHNLSGWL